MFNIELSGNRPKGDKLAYVLQLHFDCTNNMAEYEALLHGLRLAKEMNIKRIRCFGDSDLVAQQVLELGTPRMQIWRLIEEQSSR